MLTVSSLNDITSIHPSSPTAIASGIASTTAPTKKTILRDSFRHRRYSPPVISSVFRSFFLAFATIVSVSAAATRFRAGRPFARGFASPWCFGTRPTISSRLTATTALLLSSKIDNEGSSLSPKTTPMIDESTIPNNLRGLFAGAGSDGISQPPMVEQILDLLPPEKKKGDPKNVSVLYLGTASYDIGLFRDKQTGGFADRGCTVRSLDVALGTIADGSAGEAIAAADVVVVGGGNTLYAIDRWTHLGLVPHLRKAMDRGCILTGGSAGAICWFESGHSDSADPETYVPPMLEQYGGSDTTSNKDESSSYDAANKKDWKYLRVQGLGFVPGPMVCCPHHDRVQSNGVLRSLDFDQMLLRRARASKRSVLGIGIDHYAALIVEGNRYRVYALPDRAGSVPGNGGSEFAVAEDGTANGTPGVWIKRVLVANGEVGRHELVVEAMVCPPEGAWTDLLAYGGDNLLTASQDADEDNEDDNRKAVEQCRRENPSGIPL